MTCRQVPNSKDNLYQTIVFELAPIQKFGGTTKIENNETDNLDIQGKSLLELRKLALQVKNDTKTVIERKKKLKLGVL